MPWWIVIAAILAQVASYSGFGYLLHLLVVHELTSLEASSFALILLVLVATVGVLIWRVRQRDATTRLVIRLTGWWARIRRSELKPDSKSGDSPRRLRNAAFVRLGRFFVGRCWHCRGYNGCVVYQLGCALCSCCSCDFNPPDYFVLAANLTRFPISSPSIKWKQARKIGCML